MSQEQVQFEPNLLNEELILFIKFLFRNFDEFFLELGTESGLNQYYEKTKRDEIKNLGYDGELISILYNDTFWDNLTIHLIRASRIYDWLNRRYEFTVIEKNMESIIRYHPYANPFANEYVDINMMNVDSTLWDYLIQHWDVLFKDTIRSWAEYEFGICPK
jgi:hypothetical protein